MTPTQLSFTGMFEAAALETRTAHLPAAMQEAIPYFRRIIEQHNIAMLKADFDAAQKLNDEAHDLAVKLNGGEPGILADHDSPGHVLERETAAPSGAVPLWGQTGDFIIEPCRMKTRVHMEGIFGLAVNPIPGFSVQAVEYDKPFLSETGYRSFLGYRFTPVAGMTPDEFARQIVTHHVTQQLKGKLRMIDRRYRPPPHEENVL